MVDKVVVGSWAAAGILAVAGWSADSGVVDMCVAAHSDIPIAAHSGMLVAARSDIPVAARSDTLAGSEIDRFPVPSQFCRRSGQQCLVQQNWNHSLYGDQT